MKLFCRAIIAVYGNQVGYAAMLQLLCVFCEAYLCGMHIFPFPTHSHFFTLQKVYLGNSILSTSLHSKSD